MLLLTIRYGHHWRERANKKYGYDSISADEKHPPSILGNESADGAKEEDVSGLEDDAHTELPLRQPVMKGGSGLERKGSAPRSAGALPNAEAMLHRTASITASIH